ncbi:hypothetical protein T01_8615 [Trichinella spiralis]|uniref:Uncharacterized protein n=1 Tax=Trichinella spiralis TaxID=6334 RepID=A0A0V1AIP1_TRISP|nr:hypothetical protein T01_8615 [Trichinella spiralis]
MFFQTVPEYFSLESVNECPLVHYEKYNNVAGSTLFKMTIP